MLLESGNCLLSIGFPADKAQQSWLFMGIIDVFR